MSLIEEALRKTQAQQSASAPSSPERPKNPPPQVPLPTLPGATSPRARIERVFMIGGGALIAGIVVWEAWVYLAPGSQAGRTFSRTVAKASSARVMQTSLSPAVRRPLMQPTLRLSGIVGGPGEPLAIINGAIVRVGEQVAGATLLELGDDFARVRWRDQEIVLRTGE